MSDDTRTVELLEKGRPGFVCAECGGEFEKGWSDADAIAEMAVNFPGVPLEEMALVCHDCYLKLVPHVVN